MAIVGMDENGGVTLRLTPNSGNQVPCGEALAQELLSGGFQNQLERIEWVFADVVEVCFGGDSSFDTSQNLEVLLGAIQSVALQIELRRLSIELLGRIRPD